MARVTERAAAPQPRPPTPLAAPPLEPSPPKLACKMNPLPTPAAAAAPAPPARRKCPLPYPHVHAGKAAYAVIEPFVKFAQHPYASCPVPRAVEAVDLPKGASQEGSSSAAKARPIPSLIYVASWPRDPGAPQDGQPRSLSEAAPPLEPPTPNLAFKILSIHAHACKRSNAAARPFQTWEQALLAPRNSSAEHVGSGVGTCM